jgi:hypothetical protein
MNTLFFQYASMANSLQHQAINNGVQHTDVRVDFTFLRGGVCYVRVGYMCLSNDNATCSTRLCVYSPRHLFAHVLCVFTKYRYSHFIITLPQSPRTQSNSTHLQTLSDAHFDYPSPHASVSALLTPIQQHPHQPVSSAYTIDSTNYPYHYTYPVSQVYNPRATALATNMPKTNQGMTKKRPGGRRPKEDEDSVSQTFAYVCIHAYR